MKQDEGRGSIQLVIAVAVIIAVVVFGINYFKDFISKENAKDLQADMLLIQNKVEIVEGNYRMNKEANPLKGYQLTLLPETINLTSFFEKNIIAQEEYEVYYVLDSRKHGTNGFTRVNTEIYRIFYC